MNINGWDAMIAIGFNAAIRYVLITLIKKKLFTYVILDFFTE